MREVLFEFMPLGNAVKVSAIDPDSNTEVTIVGSPNVSLVVLRNIAMRKLRYVMAKKQEREAARVSHGRGIVV